MRFDSETEKKTGNRSIVMIINENYCFCHPLMELSLSLYPFALFSCLSRAPHNTRTYGRVFVCLFHKSLSAKTERTRSTRERVSRGNEYGDRSGRSSEMNESNEPGVRKGSWTGCRSRCSFTGPESSSAAHVLQQIDCKIRHTASSRQTSYA